MNAWQEVRLQDLGTWYGGGTPSKTRAEFWANGTVPWLSPKDMGPDVVRSTRDQITKAAVAGSAVRIVPKNSVALVVRSGILERTVPIALVPFETTLNQDMKAISVRPGVDARWVAWGLRALERQILSEARKAGTTVASLEVSRLREMTLPLPRLDEQRRIVDILEGHLAHLDAAESWLTFVSTKAERLTSASACRVVMGAERSAPSTTLERLALIGTGATPRRGVARYWEPATIPWVSSGELARGTITHSREHISEAALAETSVKLWPIGTLLVAMYGEGKTRGTVGELGVAATTNQACAAIVLHDRSPAMRSWVRLVLESRYEAMRSAASGGVQPNLSLGHFRNMIIPVPSESVREAAAAHHAETAAISRRLSDEVLQLRKKSQSLKKALLAAAFTGRLTGRSSDLALAEELVGE